MSKKKLVSKSLLNKGTLLGLAQVVSIGLGVTAFGGDLTVPQGTGTKLDSPAEIDKLTVKGPLTISGTGVAIVTKGTTSIGPDAGDNASVTVSDGAYQLLQGDVTYGANGGKGGKITVSGDTTMKEGWDKRSGEYMEGTFGGFVDHKISSNLTSDNGVFDLAELGNLGYLGVKQIYTENTAVKTRILFNGGAIWLKPNNKSTIFNAVAGSEIVLEGVGNNDIAITSVSGPTMTFMTGDGTVTVSGKGTLKYKITEADVVQETALGAGVNWENDGGLTISGARNLVKTTHDNVLPYMKGGVTIENGRANKGLYNVLDLNGTMQKVYSLTLNTSSYVTNTSSTRAVLEIGECATDAITLNGVIGGAIDVVIKSKFRVTYGSAFSLVGGARLLFDDLDLKNARSDGGDFVGTVVVSNWSQKVSTAPAFVKEGAKRALPESLVKKIGLEPGAKIDIQGGALCVAKFTGSEGSCLHVHSNAELRVQSQGGLACKYLRFVLKEAIDLSIYNDEKLYPNLKGLVLVKEDGTDYWPGEGYNNFIYKTADTALGDMPAGSYKFHSDKYAVGNGKDLDTVNVPPPYPAGAQRSGDYTFSRDSFLKNNGAWGGLLFTNSVPRRADAASWHVITLRLKDDGPKFSGYRFLSNWNHYSYPGCWAVEASDNGEVWTTLDEKVDYYSFSYERQNDAVSEGYNSWNIASEPNVTMFPFLWTTNIASDSVVFALNGAKVRVDRGGALDVDQTGDAAEISWLEVDAQLGGGRISFFKPAQNGVLNILNTQVPGELSTAERKVPFEINQVVDLENLKTWTVVSGGKVVENARLKLTDTGFKVSGYGLVITVR